MGTSQNTGPILVPLKFRCRNIIYNQKRPLTLGTTHVILGSQVSGCTRHSCKSLLQDVVPATENAWLVWGIQKKQLGTVRGLPKIGCAKRAQRHVGVFKQPDGYVEIRVRGLRGFTN